MNRSLSDYIELLKRKTGRTENNSDLMKKSKKNSHYKYSVGDSDPYLKMFSFNWEDQKLKAIKTNPFDNLNANAFLYYINQFYFAEKIRNSLKNEGANQIFSIIQEKIDSICNFENEETDSIEMTEIRSDHSTTQNYQFLTDLFSLINLNNKSNTEISLSNYKKLFYQKDLSWIEENFKSIITKIKKKNENLISQTILRNFNLEEINLNNKELDWVIEKGNYLNFLKNQHDEEINKLNRKNIILRFKDELKLLDDLNEYEEINCIICNDGNTLELDLNVACSQCGAFFHLSCYGVSSLLNDENWYCDVCRVFRLEQAEELECILCPVKGGAMRQCDIKVNSIVYRNIMGLRKKYENENRNEANNKKCIINQENTKDELYFKEISPPSLLIASEISLNKQSESNEIKEKIDNFENLSTNKACNNTNNQCTYNFFDNYNNDNSPIHETISGNLTEKDNLFISTTREHRDSMLMCIKNNHFQISTNSENSTSHPKNEEDNESLMSNSVTSMNNNQINNDRNPRKLALKKTRRALNAWIHLSCAMWTDGVIITKNKNEIKNVESVLINPERYKETCHICNLSNFGPVRDCDEADCNFKFHVECARINHYNMQIGMEGNKIKYKIFCNNHRKNKIFNLIHERNINQAEDILNFAEVLEKNFKLIEPQKISLKKDCKNILGPKLTKREKIDFMSQLKHVCKLFSNFNNIIVKKQSKNLKFPFDFNEYENSYVINLLNENFETSYQIEKNYFQNKLNYDEIKNSKDFPWDMIKLKNYDKDRKKKLFLKFISNEEVYNQIFKPSKSKDCDKNISNYLPNDIKPKKLQKSLNKEVTNKRSDSRYYSLNKPDNKSNLIIDNNTEEDNLYCICIGDYQDGDIMISCRNEDRCLGAFEGWFHKNCIKELRNKTNEELKDPNYIYICDKCRNNF